MTRPTTLGFQTKGFISIAIFQYILKKTQILIDIEVLKRVVPQNMDLWLSERVLQMFWMLQHMILQSIADNMIV